MLRLIVATVALLGYSWEYPPEVKMLLPKPVYVPTIEQVIVREAWAQSVPLRLAFWLAVAESGLDPSQKRYEDDGTVSISIMQLNSGSFPDAEDMTPAENAAAGIEYLAKQYRACHKRPACAVQAYRSGKVR